MKQGYNDNRKARKTLDAGMAPRGSVWRSDREVRGVRGSIPPNIGAVLHLYPTTRPQKSVGWQEPAACRGDQERRTHTYTSITT